jgi:hypothetical protein
VAQSQSQSDTLSGVQTCTCDSPRRAAAADVHACMRCCTRSRPHLSQPDCLSAELDALIGRHDNLYCIHGRPPNLSRIVDAFQELKHEPRPHHRSTLWCLAHLQHCANRQRLRKKVEVTGLLPLEKRLRRDLTEPFFPRLQATAFTISQRTGATAATG